MDSTGIAQIKSTASSSKPTPSGSALALLVGDDKVSVDALADSLYQFASKADAIRSQPADAHPELEKLVALHEAVANMLAAWSAVRNSVASIRLGVAARMA